MASQICLYIGAIFIGYQVARSISWFGAVFFAGLFYIAAQKLLAKLEFLKRKQGDSFLKRTGKDFGRLIVLVILAPPGLAVLAISVALIVLEWVLRRVNDFVVLVCRWVLKEIPSGDILGGIQWTRKLPKWLLKPYDIAPYSDKQVSQAIIILKASKKEPVPLLGVVGVVLVTVGFILELI